MGCFWLFLLCVLHVPLIMCVYASDIEGGCVGEGGRKRDRIMVRLMPNVAY